MLPHYLAIGVNKYEIMHSSPKNLQAYDKAYKIKKMIKDEELWLQGRYNLESFMVALAHFGAGLSGKTSDAEYLKKPLMQDIEDRKKRSYESNEIVAVYEMKKRTNSLRKNGLSESPM